MEKTIISKLLIMSFKFFIRLFFVCLFTQTAFSSIPAQKLSDVYISLKLENTTIKEAIDKIEKSTGFKFAYSKNLLSYTNKEIQINALNKSLKEILENISLQTGLTFRQINRTISVKTIDEDILNVQYEFPANNGRIIGVVLDQKTNEPLIGANVFIKGSSIGTATDIEGKYEIIVPESIPLNQEIEITASFVGYKTKVEKMLTSDKTVQINFALEEDIFQSEEIVVTGIASKTSKSVAEVAVSRVNAEELTQKQSFQDISQLLSGKVAGVRIENQQGGPGSGTRFNVRAGGGLNGDGQPLIIIDGIRMDNFEVGADRSTFGSDAQGGGFATLAELNPEDIEKMEVLKGPAAAASYGTNGSNGVILITTKRGQLGSGGEGGSGISVSYKHVNGWNERGEGFENVYPLTFGRVHDQFKNGPILQHSLAISGGIPVLRYRASFDQRDEGGILPNQWLDKESYRLNLDALPSDKISLSLSSAYSVAEQRRTETDNNTESLVYNTGRAPGGDASNNFVGAPWNWAAREAILARDNRTTSNRFLGSIQGIYKPLDFLEARAVIGLDFSQIKDLEYTPPGIRLNPVGTGLEPGDRDVRHRKNVQLTYDFNLTGNFDLLDNLQLTSVAGVQLFDKKWETFASQTDEFATPLISDLDAGAVRDNIAESFLHLRNGGIFTEHTFSYDDTYRLSLMVRQDYASSVGADAPTIVYPKASFSMRLDKFDFFPKSIFSLFKIRAAYGETGQLPGSRDAIRLLFEAQRNPYGVGSRLDDLGNVEIEPERIKEFELGFDTEFLSNYSFEFTYYRSFASNSIIGFENAPSTGLGIVEGGSTITKPINIGAVEGWGFETLLSGRPISTPNFQLDFTLVSSFQDNEVTDLGGAQPIFAVDRGLNVIKEGLPKHAFFAFRTLGAKFDEDGLYAGPLLSEEKEFLGTPIPTTTGSFSFNITLWRNLNIYAMTEWALGHSVMNYTQRQAIRDGLGVAEMRELADLVGADPTQSRNWQSRYKDWFPDRDPLTPGTPEYIEAANKLAKFNRISNGKGGYIEEADFLRLREVSLSYDVTDLIKETLGSYITGLTVGVSARNVWFTSKYSGIDPELNSTGVTSNDYGIDFYTTPLPRTYNFWFRVIL